MQIYNQKIKIIKSKKTYLVYHSAIMSLGVIYSGN